MLFQNLKKSMVTEEESSWLRRAGEYYYTRFLLNCPHEEIENIVRLKEVNGPRDDVKTFMTKFIEQKKKSYPEYSITRISTLIRDRSNGTIISPKQIWWYLGEHTPFFEVHEKVLDDFPREMIFYTDPTDYEYIIESYLKYIGFVETDWEKNVELYGFKVSFFIKSAGVALCINTFFDSATNFGSPSKVYVHRRTIELDRIGVRVINLFEDHLLDSHKWMVLKDIIAHACGKTKFKIYARDTEIKVFPAKEMSWFLNSNNIQSARGAKLAFTLIAKKEKYGLKVGEPIMCYTVGQAFFGKGKYDAEIARGACKLGYSVIGGATKLWNYITEFYKDRDIDGIPGGSVNKIIYYTDLNYYSGKSVQILPGNKLIQKQAGFWNFWCAGTQFPLKMKNREPMRHKMITDYYKRFYQDYHNPADWNKIITGDYLFVVNNAGTAAYLWERNVDAYPPQEDGTMVGIEPRV